MSASLLSPNLSMPVAASNETATVGGARTGTYGEILRSTALIGGSSVVNIGLAVVRTKVMAVLLGPSGVGLMGLYTSISDVTQSLAAMGIQSSGVRQIAEAVGSGDAERIARTTTVLKRVSIILGLVGAALLLALSGPVAQLTFGTSRRAPSVALLSLAVFCSLVATGQSALIQGMRRMGDLARVSILTALAGSLSSISMVYLFGEEGVAPALVGMAAVSILIAWWYGRKVQIEAPALTIAQVRQETAGLLKLGVAFMASSFLTMAAGYAVRLIVMRRLGFEAAGLYQAAWALGGLYVGLILQAMGADFYPRLTAVARNNTECNRLVNEQAQISLLLAGPGVMGTLTLAPLVVAMFYSPKFAPAVDILRWICLGMTLRVIAWPMGFIVIAKGAQQIFFWAEVAATSVHVGLAWWLVSHFGVAGSGAAFCGLYLWHALLIYAIVRRLSGFRWSAANVRTGLLFLPLTASVFCGFYLMPFRLAVTCGMLATLLSAWYSMRTVVHLVSLERVPAPLRQLVTRLGMGRPSTREYAV